MTGHTSNGARRPNADEILREVRDPDVWTYTTPHDVARLWPQLERHLGRRRAFWKYLLGRWADFGIIDFEPV